MDTAHFIRVIFQSMLATVVARQGSMKPLYLVANLPYQIELTGVNGC
jgi:hypothetical protein